MPPSSQRKQQSRTRQKLSAALQKAIVASASQVPDPSSAPNTELTIGENSSSLVCQQSAGLSQNILECSTSDVRAATALDANRSSSIPATYNQFHPANLPDQHTASKDQQQPNVKETKKKRKKKLRQTHQQQQQQQLKLKLSSNVGRVRLNMAGRPPIVAIGGPVDDCDSAENDDLSTSPVTMSATVSLSSDSASGSVSGSASASMSASPDSDLHALPAPVCAEDKDQPACDQPQPALTSRGVRDPQEPAKQSDNGVSDSIMPANCRSIVEAEERDAPWTASELAGFTKVYVEEIDDDAEFEFDAAAVAKVAKYMSPLKANIFELAKATSHCPFSDRQLDMLYSSDDEAEQKENVRKFLRVKDDSEKKHAAEVNARLASKRPTEDADRNAAGPAKKKCKLAKEKPPTRHEIPFSVESHRQLIQLVLHPAEVDMDMKMMSGVVSQAEIYRHNVAVPRMESLHPRSSVPLSQEPEHVSPQSRRRRGVRGRVQGVAAKPPVDASPESAEHELSGRSKYGRKRRCPDSANEQNNTTVISDGLPPRHPSSTPSTRGRRSGALARRTRSTPVKVSENDEMELEPSIPELRDGRQKLFVKHPDKKGWVICRKCSAAVWPPNCNKHVQTCGKPSGEE